MSTTHSEIPQEAGGDWPQNMRTPQAAAYLTEEHGLPTQPKTMRNWRSTGRGPSYKFYGLTPLYARKELDRWATTDALTPKSPSARPRRPASPDQAAA